MITTNIWILMIVFLNLATLLIHLIKHGQDRDSKYHAGVAFVTVLINMFIYYMAGLFK